MTFGERLRRHRRARGWTQYRLAVKARLQQNHLSKLESGQIRRPTWATVQALALALDLSTDTLRDTAPAPP